MRDIKFRAWDNDQSSWHEFDVNDLKPDGEKILRIISSDGTFTIEQFTGMKDKNGVDIFEGDIIEFIYWWFDGNEVERTLTGEIVYAGDLMSFQLKGVKNAEWEAYTGHSGDDYLTPFSELNFDEADFKIVGNIHENPDFLESR